MSNRKSTNYSEVLNGLKKLLESVFSTVYLTLQPQPLHNPPDTIYASLVPGKPVFLQPEMMGGGRNAVTVQAQIAVIIWTKLSVDQVQRHDEYLTNQTFGVLQAWDKMLDQMCISDILDSTGNYVITSQPIRPTESEITPGNIPGWGWLVTGLEVMWNQEMTGQVSL